MLTGTGNATYSTEGGVLYGSTQVLVGASFSAECDFIGGEFIRSNGMEYSTTQTTVCQFNGLWNNGGTHDSHALEDDVCVVAGSRL